jgi:prepilin-type N-terminal cleavage/methylation domain-containing protein
MKKQLKTFSLIELLVVMAIMASLVSLTQPALSKMLSKSHQIQCSKNKSTISQYSMIYWEDHVDINTQRQLENSNFGLGMMEEISQQPYLGIINENNLKFEPYHWNGTSSNFHKNAQMFICPSQNDSSIKKNMGYNAFLQHRGTGYRTKGILTSIESPDKTMHWIDVDGNHTVGYMEIKVNASGSSLQIGSRHNGMNSVIFLDGHHEALDVFSNISWIAEGEK